MLKFITCLLAVAVVCVTSSVSRQSAEKKITECINKTGVRDKNDAVARILELVKDFDDPTNPPKEKRVQFLKDLNRVMINTKDIEIFYRCLTPKEEAFTPQRLNADRMEEIQRHMKNRAKEGRPEKMQDDL